MSDSVMVEQDQAGITHIVLNRADHFNTLNVEVVSALHNALSSVAADQGCRVIVLRSTGRHFCAGVDLAGYGVAPGGDGSYSPQDWMATQEHIASLVTKLRTTPQPIIAAIQGAASGGGLGLALASDIRLCAKDARFNAAFVKIGLSGCDIGVSWLLPRIIGSARAFELLLTGRFVDANEASQIGLVASVVGGADLVDHATEIALAIGANSPYGIRLTKQVMWAQLEVASLEVGLALENRTQVTAAMTADHREATTAFLEKRMPQFRNE